MQKLGLLVIGATGQQGGAVAARALRRGHRVRALVRDPNASAAEALQTAGATLHVGDLDDSQSLVAAFQHADGVFAVLSNAEGIAVERRRGCSIFQAAFDTGVRHVVYSSAAAADTDIPVPHLVDKRAIEDALRLAGVPWTIVAPVYFMEAGLSDWAVTQLRGGSVTRFLPVEQPLQQIALADIGSIVVQLFERGERFFGRRIELAGDSVSTRDQARILGKLLDSPLQARQAPLELLTAGGSETMERLAVMMRWLGREGFRVDIPALHREFSETPWTSFSDWAARQDWQALVARA